jgi:hypothetical protein
VVQYSFDEMTLWTSSSLLGHVENDPPCTVRISWASRLFPEPRSRAVTATSL